MARGVVAALSGLGLVTLSSSAFALSGTHPIVVSTWDARASSVQLEYRHGFVKGGGFNDVAYNANFSSTSGVLSAQFGIHYENYIAHHSEPTAHGLAATATAVFQLPLMRRYANGLPMIALGLYVGAAPTGLISGSLNYVSIPAVLGVGLSLSPVKFVTFTPWFELSPGVNLDTEVKPYQFTPADAASIYDPVTGKVTLTNSDVEHIVTQSVKLKASVAAGARGGVNVALHLSDAVDFAGIFALGSSGPAFAGRTITYLGGGFTWRWDDIVPAVLPSDRRLLHESCDDIETRFRSCPNSERWKPPPPAAPAATPESAPSPAPLAPAPPAATTSPPAAPAPVAPPPPAPAPAAAPTPAPAGTGTFPP